jgi:hypothetical protein
MKSERVGEFAYRPYALLRKGTEGKWDGWYDLFRADGVLVRSHIRVPSRDGFDDPELACTAAEIVAQFDINPQRG